MKIIIGLGNPGKEYEQTRHNLGFMVLDKLSGRADWTKSNKGQALFCKKEINDRVVELIKPQTFMNNSGLAAGYFAKKNQTKAEQILVIYDDLDLPLGKIRIGKFKSAGGHNGVKSIIEHLHTTDFIRIRIGIQTEISKKIPAEKFVLQKFTSTEKKIIDDVLAKVVGAVKMALTEPLDKVMNKYN